LFINLKQYSSSFDVLPAFKKVIDKQAEQVPDIEKSKVDHGNAFVLNNKGLVLFRLGNYTEAIECYDKSLALDPSNSKIWNNKGLVLFRLGNYTEAIECRSSALLVRKRDY
jgi:tetratricopeptide (TPR) repeat protein